MNQIDKWINEADKKGLLAEIARAEKDYGIPANLLFGVARQESAFNPKVISGEEKSSAGAIGLMQFMPATAKDENVDPLDTKSAVRGAAKYLRKLYDQTNSWSGALTSYNWGIGNYKKWVSGEKKFIPKEASEYAGLVIGHANDREPVELVDSDSNSDSVPELIGPPTPETLSPDLAPVPQNTTVKSDLPAGKPIDLLPMSEPEKLVTHQPVRGSVQTPFGEMGVIPESPLEENLVRELTSSGESQLLGLVPELINARDTVSIQSLLPKEYDTFDTLLADLIDKA